MCSLHIPAHRTGALPWHCDPRVSLETSQELFRQGTQLGGELHLSQDHRAVTAQGQGQATVHSLHAPACGTCAHCRGVRVANCSSTPAPCCHCPKILGCPQLYLSHSWMPLPTSPWPHPSCLAKQPTHVGSAPGRGYGEDRPGAQAVGLGPAAADRRSCCHWEMSPYAMIPLLPWTPGGGRTDCMCHSLGCPLCLS